MVALDKLVAHVHMGQVIDPEGSELRFIGQLSSDLTPLTAVEEAVECSLPAAVRTFIHTFGGMTLYVDCYGLGVRVLRSKDIKAHNIEQQKTTDEFWPGFVIFGYLSSDDMLVLHREREALKFGVLDHEAWAVPEVWAAEAVSWFDFSVWLDRLVATMGNEC